MSPQKKFLSTDEVAEWFGVKPRTVTNWATMWVDSGGKEGIPALRLNGLWRFERAEIEAWLDGRRIRAVNSALPVNKGRIA